MLFNSDDDEFQRLHEEILRYLRFLRDVSAAGEVDDGLLKAWFMFPEVKQNWLGFSLSGNHGSGLGIKFARALNANLNVVFQDFGKETVTRSSHLEKVCLIKDGVGRDNISDFTTNLIKEHLLLYTQEFTLQYIAPSRRDVFKVPRVRFDYDTRTWTPRSFTLPVHAEDFVILTPKAMLTKDDTWINRSDMVRQFRGIAHAIPDDALRAQLNDYFARRLPKSPSDKDVRDAIWATIRTHPAYVDYFIKHKEDTGDDAVSAADERVREIHRAFVENVQQLTRVLATETGFYQRSGGTYAEARDRVLFLKDVIENKGGHRFFLDKHGRPLRNEADLQRLYRLCWYTTPSDVSREVDDGRGPVDFKVSRGAKSKTLVEFKLASNGKLKRNLERQVEIYKKASDAKRALKVILAFSEAELLKVEKTLKQLKLHGSRNVIVIDGSPTNKPSGSNA